MSASTWWQMYGSEVPELQRVAMRVTGQVAGAGAAERGHKEVNFVLNKQRNRTGYDRVLALFNVCTSL